MNFKVGDQVVSIYNQSPSYQRVGVIVHNAFYGYRVRFPEPLGDRYFGRDTGLIYADEYFYKKDFQDKIRDRMS